MIGNILKYTLEDMEFWIILLFGAGVLSLIAVVVFLSGTFGTPLGDRWAIALPLGWMIIFLLTFSYHLFYYATRMPNN